MIPELLQFTSGISREFDEAIQRAARCIEHDSGILLLPDGSRMVLVILTKGWQDQRQAKGMIARVARTLFDSFSQGN